MIKTGGIIIILIIALILLIPLTARSQAPDTSWVRYYGGEYPEECWDAEQTSDGGFVIVGATQPDTASFYDVYLVRIDADGNEIWARNYGGSHIDVGRSVKETDDGGFIIAGYTASYGIDEIYIYLIRTDQYGDTLWTRTYGQYRLQWGRSLDICEDGGFIIAGWSSDFAPDNVYLIRTDSLGNELWSRTFGGSDNEHAWSVIQSSDGGYAVAGWTESTVGRMADIYVIKTDANGDSVWSTTLGGVRNDEARAIVEVPGQGFAVAGKTVLVNGQVGFCLAKIDPDGIVLWERTYAHGYEVVGHSLYLTIDNGFIIGGYNISNIYDYVLRTDSAGNTIWTKSIFFGYYTDCRAVMVTEDGGYAVAGKKDGDIYLAKLEPEQTAIDDDFQAPREFLIFQNYPNPFNASTLLRYELQQLGQVTISIYNIIGQKVAVLYDGYQSVGIFDITWNASDYPSGIYFARLETTGITRNLKMVFLK